MPINASRLGGGEDSQLLLRLGSCRVADHRDEWIGWAAMSLGRRTWSLLALLIPMLASLAADAIGRPVSPVGVNRPPDAATDEQLSWLIETHGRLVYRAAIAVTHNEALAEDVVQDTMFKAWISMPSWEGNVPVRWLRTVARNRAISVMRHESRSGPDEAWDLRASTEPDVERVVEGRVHVDAMRAALAGLGEESRTMIVLRENEGLTYDEIAELLGLTPSAVKAKLYRSRHQLKTQLREWDS